MLNLYRALLFLVVSSTTLFPAYSQNTPNEEVQSSSEVAVETESACAPSELIYTIEKGFNSTQLKAVKTAIHKINKDIPIQENKTWTVYTLPILKRKNLYLIRNKEAEIVGYAALKDDNNYLSWIAIKKEYRGKDKGSLAKRLMSRILVDFGSISLSVRASNKQAINFYEGLSDIATVEHVLGETYSNGEREFLYTISSKSHSKDEAKKSNTSTGL